MSGNLRSKSIHGIKWTTIEYILTFSLQLIQLAVLARLLTPEDFGVFAIGTFFTTLGNSVFALGLGPALIQKQGDIKEYLNTAWTSNLLISIFSTFVLIGFSKLIVGKIFNSPEALLPALVMLSVVTISGFNNISIVRFYKEIELRGIFVLNTLPRILGVGTMIGIALVNPTYWALVFGVIVEYTTRCIVSYLLYPYWPKIELNIKKFKELYSFGGWLQMKNLVNWLASYIDVAIVGNLLNIDVLGFYNRAQSVARIPQNQVNSIVNTVSFPLYSKVLNNNTQLQKAFNSTNDLVLLIIFPLITVMLLFGKQIVILILGEQWVYLTGTLQLLITAVAIQSYIYSFYPLLRALGYPRMEFIFQIMKISVLVILIYPLTKMYGISGAGLAVLTSVIVITPVILHRIIRLTKLSFTKILESFIISLVGFLMILPAYFYFLEMTFSYYESIIWIIMIVTIYIILVILFSWFTRKGPGMLIINNYQPIWKLLSKS